MTRKEGRTEHRYFCSVASWKIVELRMDSMPGFTRISYLKPVTETIYFTLGEKAGYAMLPGLTVRLRRYVTSLSETMGFRSGPTRLELKRENQKTGINIKGRIEVDGLGVVQLLADKYDQAGFKYAAMDRKNNGEENVRFLESFTGQKIAEIQSFWLAVVSELK